MKKYIYSILLLLPLSLWSLSSAAQADKTTRPSPFTEFEGQLKQTEIKIQYSSPAVKGRTIWGELVPYSKVWRTGANEATTFETSKDMLIQGEMLPAGKYALFSIVEASGWTWIFNETWDQWGSFRYDEKKDVLRVTVEHQSSPVFHERMTFKMEDNSVLLYWENLKVPVN